jgi:hypothetical protein
MSAELKEIASMGKLWGHEFAKGWSIDDDVHGGSSVLFTRMHGGNSRTHRAHNRRPACQDDHFGIYANWSDVLRPIAAGLFEICPVSFFTLSAIKDRLEACATSGPLAEERLAWVSSLCRGSITRRSTRLLRTATLAWPFGPQLP